MVMGKWLSIIMANEECERSTAGTPLTITFYLCVNR